MEFKSNLSKKYFSLLLINTLSMSVASYSHAEESSRVDNFFGNQKKEVQIPVELQKKALECKTDKDEKTNTERIVDELLLASENSNSGYFLLDIDYRQACKETDVELANPEPEEITIIKERKADALKKGAVKDSNKERTNQRKMYTLDKKLMYGPGDDRLCGEYKALVKLTCMQQTKHELGLATINRTETLVDTGSDYTFFIVAYFPSTPAENRADSKLSKKWEKNQNANGKYLSGDYLISDTFTDTSEEGARLKCFDKLEEYKRFNTNFNFRIKKESAYLLTSKGKSVGSSNAIFNEAAKQIGSDINFSISKPSEDSKYDFSNHANFNCSISREKEYKQGATELTRLYMDYDMDGATSFCYNHPNRIGDLISLRESSKKEENSYFNIFKTKSFFEYFNFQKMDLNSNDSNLIVKSYYNELEAPVFASDYNKTNFYSAPHTVEVIKLQKIQDDSMVFIRLILDFKNKRSLVITYDKANPYFENIQAGEPGFFNTTKSLLRSTYWKNHKDDWKNWTDDTSYNDKPGVRSLKIFGLGNCVYQN